MEPARGFGRSDSLAGTEVVQQDVVVLAINLIVAKIIRRADTHSETNFKNHKIWFEHIQESAGTQIIKHIRIIQNVKIICEVLTQLLTSEGVLHNRR